MSRAAASRADRMEGAPAAGVSRARRLLGVWQRRAQASLHGRASVPVPPQCCRRNFLRCDAPRGVRGRQERTHRQGSERLRILAHANQGTELVGCAFARRRSKPRKKNFGCAVFVRRPSLLEMSALFIYLPPMTYHRTREKKNKTPSHVSASARQSHSRAQCRAREKEF